MPTVIAIRTLSLGDDSWSEAMQHLAQEGHHVIESSEDQLIAGSFDASQVEALLLETTPVDSALLGRLPSLRIISKCGSGIDNIDVDAAADHDVEVVATPGANAETVADHTFALILALSREILPLHQATVSGHGWAPWPPRVGTELQAHTLGVLGTGFVGRAVIRRARAFSMDVVAHDLHEDQDLVADGVKYLPLERLLNVADVVTVHLPLTACTRGLIGRGELRRMKPNALLINVARGGIVDERELAEALRAGRIRGAGIDVYAKEPAVETPLYLSDRVLCTPHAAGVSHAAIRRARLRAAEAICDRLRGHTRT